MGDNLEKFSSATPEEMTELIAEMRQKLVEAEKMVLLGQLVAGIAHEINTPLGALRSNNDLFIRAMERVKCIIFADDAPEEIRQNASLLKVFGKIDQLNTVNKTAGERITSIVSGIKNYARKEDPDPSHGINVADILDSALALALHEYKNRIRIEKEYRHTCTISGYPNHLSQVFLNIIVNATQAIESSGEITIKTSDDEFSVIILICDTGKGIREADLKQVFTPGFTTKSSGMGMGLSIVHDIIEEHQGEITVSSEVGKGTCFRIQLPRKRV